MGAIKDSVNPNTLVLQPDGTYKSRAQVDAEANYDTNKGGSFDPSGGGGIGSAQDMYNEVYRDAFAADAADSYEGPGSPTWEPKTLDDLKGTVRFLDSIGNSQFSTEFDPRIPDEKPYDAVTDDTSDEDPYDVEASDNNEWVYNEGVFTKGNESITPSGDMSIFTAGGIYTPGANGEIFDSSGTRVGSGSQGADGSYSVTPPPITSPNSNPYEVPNNHPLDGKTHDNGGLYDWGDPNAQYPGTGGGSTGNAGNGGAGGTTGGGGTGKGTSGEDPNTDESEPTVPPIIPVPGEPDMPNFLPDDLEGWLKAGSAAASAVTGAINVSNQFDFLENAPEDQMKINRQAAVDSSTLMNPNYENPYGFQTTIPGSIDRVTGQLIPPSVKQTLKGPQQQLFDTDTNIKQGLGDTALKGIGGVQSQFDTPYDPSGLIDRYQVDPNNLSQYSDINLGDLSGRQTQPGVTGRNAITEAMIAREQPRFDRAEEQMRNRLLTQGFNPGTEGFIEQTDEFGRAKNDFNLAAQSAGAAEQSRLFGLESALRGQQLQEQDTQRVGNAQNREQQVGEQMDFGRYTSDERARMLQEDLTLRNLPLNELNTLRQGTQATVPQFQPFNATGVNPAGVSNYQQAQTAGNYADGFFGLGGELLDWFGNRTAKPASGPYIYDPNNP